MSGIDGTGQIALDNAMPQNRNNNHQQEISNNKKWLDELAKADERGNRFRLQLEETQKKKVQVEERLQVLERQVQVREDEIKRLQKLYEGGQNLEVLSVRHTHETNEKTICKLANQVEFLNKENHNMHQQLLLYKGDKAALKTLDSYKADLDNLTFENQTLKKDLDDSSRLLKEYQEREL